MFWSRLKASEWGAAGLVGLATLLLALAQTGPLLGHLSDGIPYGHRVVPGYEAMPFMPGDHLQFLYWCWVLVDNLLGPSALFTNPYEFNTFLSAGVPNYANFPWSLIYLALYGLGPVLAYNLMVYITYPLTGLCAYALVREVTGDRLAALPAALACAFLPLRVAQISGGHLEGFVLFLVPLVLWCLERGWRKGSWVWGAGAGLGLLALAWMALHLIFYTVLLLGLYVPLRLLSMDPACSRWEGRPRDALWPALVGIALGLTAHMALARRTGAPLLAWDLVPACLIYLLGALAAWLLLSWMAASFTRMGPGQTRQVAGRGLAPLVLAPLYLVQAKLNLPYLGSVLLAVLGLWSLWRLAGPMWAQRRKPRMPHGWWRPLVPLALGLAASAGRLLYHKVTTLDSSIAQGGRSLEQVMLFSPRLGDLWLRDNPQLERLIIFSAVVAGLALLGLLLLALARPARASQGGAAALWGFTGLLAVLLSIGPTMRVAPLYALLHRWVPFFNFPRVPGRLVMIAVLLLSLLAGWALAQVTRSWRQHRWVGVGLALGLLALLAWDTWPANRMGICLLPPPGAVEARVVQEMEQGPQSRERILGLPIWPGDSHQSSIYELLISRTRVIAVNGYSPVVSKAYVDQVFWPLYPLDLGEVNQAALDTLRRLKVRLVDFHDNQLIYTPKVSPFPPALARQRLLASGAFEPLEQQGTVFLWRFNPRAKPDPDPGALSSPVTSLWEAPWLSPRTGRLVEDQEASGWGLLFEGSLDPAAPRGRRLAKARGNLVQARAGRDRAGLLARGPGKFFPPGRYLARFRLRRGAGPIPGWVAVTAKGGKPWLARAELDPQRLPPDGRWHDVGLAFQLKKATALDLRVYFAGVSDLDLDLALVSFADQIEPPDYYRAQDLWRQTGDLVRDRRVEGSLAVEALRGLHPYLYLMHGPQQTYQPGRYRASFLMARSGPAPAEALVAEVAVARDLGRRTLAWRQVKAAELSEDYREITLEFELDRPRELGFRVRYLGGADLRLAGANVRRL